MKINEIAFTCYPVTDMARARAFYEGVLGLVPTTIHEPSEGFAWTEYDLGDNTFALGIFAGWTPSNEGGNVAFEVEDFEATVIHLRNADVKFRMEPIETSGCHMAMAIDPDGTSVCIHKRKQP